MRNVLEVRAALKSIPKAQRCHRTCPGWGIFEVNRLIGVEICACDECNSALPADQQLSDDEIEQLPEARQVLHQRLRRDGTYTALDAYDSHRALDRRLDQRGPQNTLIAISNVLRTNGFDMEGW